MEVNKSFWKEFIELYKENRCLWDVKSSDYCNKPKRKASYDVLLNKLREMMPKANLEFVKKKINNLRTTFRREAKKVQDSKELRSESVYEPNLWYYNLLLFILQNETEEKEKSNTDEIDGEYIFFENSVSNDENEYDSDRILKIEMDDTPPSPSQLSFHEHETDAAASTSRSQFQVVHNSEPQIKKRKLNFVQGSSSAQDEECAITGQKMGFQLKAMVERQRLIAEKIISDVMFLGRTEQLRDDAIVHPSATRCCKAYNYDLQLNLVNARNFQSNSYNSRTMQTQTFDLQQD